MIEAKEMQLQAGGSMTCPYMKKNSEQQEGKQERMDRKRAGGRPSHLPPLMTETNLHTVLVKAAERLQLLHNLSHKNFELVTSGSQRAAGCRYGSPHHRAFNRRAVRISDLRELRAERLNQNKSGF